MTEPFEVSVATRRASGCEAKKAFATWSKAERNARGLNRHRKANVSPYHCQFCGAFHVGSSLGGRKKVAA